MSYKFRAILLAAGMGTRLRPITNNVPKCLVEIANKPLLAHWLEELEFYGCEEVLINTHHLSEQVNLFLSKWESQHMKISSFYEEKLLGTAGTLKKHISFFKEGIGLLIHADNFTNMNIRNLIASHKKRHENTILTMATFKTHNPSSCGIVEIDKNNVLIDFHEKVRYPAGNIANGAIYAFDNEFLEYFSQVKMKTNDFSTEIIPMLKGRIQTSFTGDIFIDIGTPSSLHLARQLVSKSN